MTNPPSEHVIEFAWSALDLAMDRIKKGGPLIPFTLIRHNNEDNIKVFVADTLEESVAEAKAQLAKDMQYADIGLVAYDGYLTVDDQRTDAIFTETYERGSQFPHRLAMRYKSRLFGGSKPVGNAVYLGNQ